MKPFNEYGTQFAKFTDNGQDCLHGDVIISMNDMPDGFETWPVVKDGCLAHGEATGHHHKIVSGDFDLRECPKTKVKHLRVVTEAFLKHQEHSPIVIPPGDYRIGIQKEYDPFEKRVRQVAD